MKRTFKIFLKIFITLAIIALAAVAAVNAYVCASVYDRIYSADELSLEKADCILVLGAGVRNDGSPSHMLEDRLIVGKTLYEYGVSDYILLSGDHGQEEYDEVNCNENDSGK